MRRTSNFFGLGAGGMDIEVEVGEEGCLFVSARSAGVANRDRLYSSAAMNPKNLATTLR